MWGQKPGETALSSACEVFPVQVAPGIIHPPTHCTASPSSACRLSQHHPNNAPEFVCSLVCYGRQTSLQFCKLSMNCCIQVEWNQLENLDGFACITLLRLKHCEHFILRLQSQKLPWNIFHIAGGRNDEAVFHILGIHLPGGICGNEHKTVLYMSTQWTNCGLKFSTQTR